MLIVVGFLHAMLLYVGDILAAYGVLLFVAAWVAALQGPDAAARGLLLFLVLAALPSGGLVDDRHRSALTSRCFRPTGRDDGRRADPQAVAFVALLGPLGFVWPRSWSACGAARRRILEQPERSPAVCCRGAAVARDRAPRWLGAQPIALTLSGASTSR